MNMFRPNRSILNQFNRAVFILFCLVLVVAATAGASEIVDRKGRHIQVESAFKRIISLYGAHTENLFYLGLDPEIIGVSVNDQYPAAVRKKQRFSYHDDPEKFLAVQPDLVLIRPMIDHGYPLFVQQLEKYGITVVSLQPGSVPQMYQYWLTLGRLTGKETQSREMVTAFKEKIAGIQHLTQTIPRKKRVYFEAIHSRMKTFTPGAMAIFALETAGGINVASDARSSRKTNIAIYGKEQILAKADQIDVFLSQKGIMNPVTRTRILQEPGFSVIKAIKTNQVFLIDEHLVSRPVPRLYQGVVTIGKYLYPDLFRNINIKKDIE
jgi:iron complex transport system substrate-binding protein